jgi:hypothetical protein
MPSAQSYNPTTNRVTFTPEDVDAVSRLVQSEVANIMSNPTLSMTDRYQAAAMVVDSVVNRVASVGYSVYGTSPTRLATTTAPTTIQAVIDAVDPRRGIAQYSPIAATLQKTWTGLPAPQQMAQDFTNSYLGLRDMGMPPMGYQQPEDPFAPDAQPTLGTHYVNPEIASPAWAAKLRILFKLVQV